MSFECVDIADSWFEIFTEMKYIKFCSFVDNAIVLSNAYKKRKKNKTKLIRCIRKKDYKCVFSRFYKTVAKRKYLVITFLS